MHSIDTYYDGNYFRSRLEARWVVFFNDLKIKYLYEPEGFSYRGQKYLPDFFLPETYLRDSDTRGLYLEIKPITFKEQEFTQGGWFEKNIVLFCGTPMQNIWAGDRPDGYDGGYEYRPRRPSVAGDRTWDNLMGIWLCSSCGTSKIEFAEGNYNNCPVCKKTGCDVEKIMSASTKANMFRFEHKARHAS